MRKREGSAIWQRVATSMPFDYFLVTFAKVYFLGKGLARFAALRHD
jgi:hypothetical protein